MPRGHPRGGEQAVGTSLEFRGEVSKREVTFRGHQHWTVRKTMAPRQLNRGESELILSQLVQYESLNSFNLQPVESSQTENKLSKNPVIGNCKTTETLLPLCSCGFLIFYYLLFVLSDVCSMGEIPFCCMSLTDVEIWGGGGQGVKSLY